MIDTAHARRARMIPGQRIAPALIKSRVAALLVARSASPG
jgi:hypothetical protein